MDIKYLLPHLHYFWAVAKTKNYFNAAEELQIPQSSVSYQIKLLEAVVNTKLTNVDEAHNVTLTDKGMLLAEQCSSIFNSINDIMGQISSNDDDKKIKISTTVSYGTHLVVPAIKSCSSSLSHLHEYNIVLNDEEVDMKQNEVDLAFRAQVSDPDISCVFVMSVRYIAVASREYLNNNPEIRSIEDIKQHYLVCNTGHNYEWQRLMNAYALLELPPEQNITYINNNFALLCAIKEGFGIGLLPDYFVAAEANEQDIVQVLPEYLGNEPVEYMDKIWACCSKNPNMQEKIMRFLQLFKNHLLSDRCVVNNHFVNHDL